MICIDTPIKLYDDVWVKREDLSCPPPGPPFSKTRGLEGKLISLKAQGITTVGYMDTSVSMAGWSVSFFCQQYDMTAVIFYPEKKSGKHDNNLDKHIAKWYSFGATVFPLDNPTQMKINWYRARSILQKGWPDTFMLEQGFPYEEAVRETAKQVALIPKNLLNGTVVISVGSGVICSGVLQGLSSNPENESTEIYGITVAPKDPFALAKKIHERTHVFFNRTVPVFLVHGGYEYTEAVDIEVPFNCNRYYDRKAWKWLLEHKQDLKSPVIFWNIGGEGQ